MRRRRQHRGQRPIRERGLTGSISISGSSTVQPITSWWPSCSPARIPTSRINVDGPGTGDGFVLFCQGETDVADASRAIEEEEVTACKDGGDRLRGAGGRARRHHGDDEPRQPGLECLTTGDLYALFGPESEGFEDWSDADALAPEVGGNGGFPRRPLEITAPGRGVGHLRRVHRSRGDPRHRGRARRRRGRRGSAAHDYQVSPNDNVIIQAMEGTTRRARIRRVRVRRGGGRSGQGARDRRRRRMRRADERDDRGRHLPAIAVALHLRQQDGGERRGPGAFVDLYLSEDGLDRGRGGRLHPASRRPPGGHPLGLEGSAARAASSLRGVGAASRRSLRPGTEGKLAQMATFDRARARSIARCGGARAGGARRGIVRGVLSPPRSSRSSSALRSSSRCSARPSTSSPTSISALCGPTVGSRAAAFRPPDDLRRARWWSSRSRCWSPPRSGSGAAMYLSEYAQPRVRRTLKPILETLAGHPERGPRASSPSTVDQPGRRAAPVRATQPVHADGRGDRRRHPDVPLIASVAEDAMFAVPGALREAAYGIGARRRTVTTQVVFPAAVSGIVAALILGHLQSASARRWSSRSPPGRPGGAIVHRQSARAADRR